MSTVLYIKASPKENKESITFKISESFVKEYKKNNPDDKIVKLNLYKENIDFLSNENIVDMEKDLNSVVRKYAIQFKKADKYIFAAPFWNLSIPAVLKAYIDYVCYSGVSFEYTESGPVGLLNDKKAVYIVSYGGIHSEKYDFAKGYLYAILKLMGIEDIKTISCENTSVLLGKDLDKAVKDSVNIAKEMAVEF